MSLPQSTSLAVPDLGVSFSPSLVGIPIATVCPISLGSAQGSLGEDAPFDFVWLPTISTGGLISSIYPASAVMADGSMTTFSSLMRRNAEVLNPADVTTSLPNGDLVIDMMASASLATIIIGSDGCQTLYSPTMTTVCATTVTPLGYAPVAITDCNQYVTFSSETLVTCSPTPAFTPKPAYSSVTNTSTTSLATTVEGKERIESSAPDINDLAVPLLRRELTYSTAPNDEIPMSLPRHLLPENQLHKRQILVSNGGPVSTDLVLVTPTASTTPSVISPTSISGVLLTLPSFIHDTLDSARNGGDDYAATATDSSMTKWFSVPGVLRAKHARDAARAIIHKRQLPESSNNNISVSINATSTEVNSTLAQDLQPLSVLSADIMNTSTSTPSPEPTFNILPTTINRLENLSPPQPTKYYIAPWQEIVQGGVPTHVKGLICYGGLEPLGSCSTPDTDGDMETCECEIHDEVWSVTSITYTRVGTTVVSFTGDAVVSTMNVTKTTSLQFQTTLTTTRTEVVGRVIKHTVKANATAAISGSISGTDEATIYATTQTTYPSVTKTLLPVEPSVSSPPTSSLPVTDFPLSSVTGSLETDNTLSGSVDGTVLVTSTIATETITIPPIDTFNPLSENGPAETDSPDLAANVQREAWSTDAWPTDVWLADISGTPIAVETVYASV